MGATAQFATTPAVGRATISAADGSRTSVAGTTVLTAGASGTLLTRIEVVATAATTAGMVRIFLEKAGTFTLWREIPVSAITPSATVQAFQSSLNLPPGTVLGTGYTVRATTEKAESFNVTVFGGDL